MRRKSWDSVGIRLFKLDYEKVMEELTEYAREALRKGARAVFLVGSLARGDYTAFSDADVIVIMDEAAERPMDRIKAFIDPGLSIDVEPRVYTVREIMEMAREGRRLVRELVSYGKLLAGDGRLMEEVRKALMESGAGA